jgi:glycine cleavage system transcriptional repressor
MKNLIVLSAVGADRPGIVNRLSRAILDSGCNIEDSRMAVLGEEFALIVMISGTWDAIAKIEAMIPRLESSLELMITVKRTAERAPAGGMIPYMVDVIAMDHPGIVHELAAFFSEHNVNIEEMSTGSYPAAHTGTPMFSLNLIISIPAQIPIARLRDQFMDFCDELNLDAVMEPVKGGSGKY